MMLMSLLNGLLCKIANPIFLHLKVVTEEVNIDAYPAWLLFLSSAEKTKRACKLQLPRQLV